MERERPRAARNQRQPRRKSRARPRRRAHRHAPAARARAPRAAALKDCGKGRAAYLPGTSGDWEAFEDAVRWLMGEEEIKAEVRGQKTEARSPETESNVAASSSSETVNEASV